MIQQIGLYVKVSRRKFVGIRAENVVFACIIDM